MARQVSIIRFNPPAKYIISWPGGLYLETVRGVRQGIRWCRTKLYNHFSVLESHLKASQGLGYHQ